VRTAPGHVSDEPAPTPTDAPMQRPDEGPKPADGPLPERSRADEIRDRVRSALDPGASVDLDEERVRR